jgi:glycosyltransferase involved in cell wall biosynthesis
MKRISIVTPCYNEEATVADCHAAIKRLFENELSAYDYEHLFCDNGSKDGTVGILRSLAAQDPHVKVILNSRNFGAFRSMFNGMMATTGDAVVCFLPADLQDPPEIIVQFAKHWEEGYEIVYGIRANRQEGLVMRTVRSLYYRTVSRLADITIPRNVGEFQLVDRKVIEALRKFDDYYPYVRGLIASCGFNSIGVSYTWRRRQAGKSTARLYHLIDQGLNGIISFTNVPMRLCMFFGLTVAALSLVFAIVAFVLGIIFYREVAPPGIPTLIVALFFFSGVQLFVLGLIGEYVSVIHFQVRKRPLVIERERINFPKPEPHGDSKPAEFTEPKP